MRKSNLWAVAAVAALLIHLAASSSFATEKQDPNTQSTSISSGEDTSRPPDDTATDQDLIVQLDLNSDQTPADAQPPDDPSSIRSIVEGPERVRSIALQFIGTPYRWGGTTPRAFDCSGFTRYIYSKVGIRLPRTAREQYKSGKPVRPGKMATGDLVFFNTIRGYVSHVGMYLGARAFIHASNPRTGVKIDTLAENYYKRHFVGARRYQFT